MMARELPKWQECLPPEPGVYITFSADPKRHDAPGIGEWNGEVWQMHFGWYDHAITHWMATDLNPTLKESDHG